MLRNFSSNLVLPVVLAGSLFLAITQDRAHAQGVADDAARQAEQIERDRAADERQRLIEKNRLDNLPPDGANVSSPQEDVAASDGACVHVNVVSVTGTTLLRAREIRKITAPFEDRCLGHSDLNGILEQLTFLYVEKGFITSRAFLPEQDLSDGFLEIVVVEGSLEDIVIDDEPDAHAGRAGTAFPDMVGLLVNLRDIEQGLDQLNRLRSNSATIELEAGENLGSSVLSVARSKGKNWYVTLGFDDLGSSSTGEYQSRIDLGFEDVLRLNDQWHFSYQRSTDDNLFFSNLPGSDTYTGSFSLPYGYWTFTLNGSWSEYDSQIAGAVSEVDTSGLSHSASASVSRVVHRDQTSITSFSGKIKWKRTENFILGSKVDVSSRDLSVGTLEFIHSRQLWDGQLTASLGHSRGLEIRGSFDDDTAPAGSPKGQFRSLNASLGYFKPFQLGDLAVAYKGQVSGQYTPDLLFGSEQVAYGGYSTVRGLRESIVFGNHGVMTRNEFALRLSSASNKQFAKLLGTLEIYTSADFGYVFEEDEFGIDGGNLAGATIGLRARGGWIGFDVVWSDIVASSGNLEAAVSESGLLYARVNLAF